MDDPKTKTHSKIGMQTLPTLEFYLKGTLIDRETFRGDDSSVTQHQLNPELFATFSHNFMESIMKTVEKLQTAVYQHHPLGWIYFFDISGQFCNM